MGYEPLDRDVVGTHEKPLVEEEQKLLEGFEERPLGEQAEALVGQHPPLASILKLVKSKKLPLFLCQQGLVVFLRRKCLNFRLFTILAKLKIVILTKF